MIDTYEFDGPCKGYFNNSASIIPVLLPFAVSVVFGIPTKKVRKRFASDETYLLNKHYSIGFNSIKNRKRAVYSFAGSLSGVVSVLTSFFIHQKDPSCP